MNWDESFKDYAVKIAVMYKTYPEKILDCMRFESVAGCLNETYQSLVKTKQIKPIEELPEQEKKELWKQSSLYSEKIEQRLLISRSIYLLETLTKP